MMLKTGATRGTVVMAGIMISVKILGMNIALSNSILGINGYCLI